ncbi:MAG: TRAM domain-containing protein [Syntrophomonadaceae bacterium]|nr:TRAM domain-containing protein [Syntrophomonadaceae bacterium]
MKRNNISLPLLLAALLMALATSLAVNSWLHLSLPAHLLLGVGLFLAFSLLLLRLRVWARRVRVHVNDLLDHTPIQTVLGGFIGMLAGVLTGFLFSYPLSLLPRIGGALTLLIFVFCGWLGANLGARRFSDCRSLLRRGQPSTPAVLAPLSRKVLDTSAIIDGRIYDVAACRFLEGILTVPTFVVEELHHIADSADSARRSKGRRGLELLAKMQKHPVIKVDIMETIVPEEREVDMKLLRLCRQLDASIVTNDYNLNKVAELQGITVLNINELINAVKLIVYPGEAMQVNILKEGKEQGQGIAYMEDGTMVVVEDASHEIGQNLDVVVTSVFQTAAGRMVFTRKIKDAGTPEPKSVGIPLAREIKAWG